MKNKQAFIHEMASPKNQKWVKLIKRENELYSRKGDIRNDFERDYTRLLHSYGYRRLKNKTQVFFAVKNDHVCTRIEHVNHVASVSSTIAKQLGLNDQLTTAIAIGHDIGHAPFGHHGEKCLDTITKQIKTDGSFWHERNSLFFVDNIETLQDTNGYERNLNLTYAVRDGLICHCGELNEKTIVPRTDNIDLYGIDKPGEYQPYTWEGCVVKISDKISYLGRDIEDAIQYKIFDMSLVRQLRKIIKSTLGDMSIKTVNNTVLINDLIVDLCETSGPKKGLCFSDKYLEFINKVKEFNYEYIYKYWRIEEFKKYASLVINTIYLTLQKTYPYIMSGRFSYSINGFQLLEKYFMEWLIKYTNYDLDKKEYFHYSNKLVYSIADKRSFDKCVVDFISGMTDQFAIRVYNEIIEF
jgi:dGTPase